MTNDLKQIKISPISVDCYLLTIHSAACSNTQISHKILALRNLDSAAKSLMIEFHHNIPLVSIEEIFMYIQLHALENEFYIYCIAAHPSIVTTAIAHIPVIALPLKPIFRGIASHNKTLKLQENIRNGIQIKHDGDVIIIGTVSDFAEIIASGNIHIYGQARGKLIAGSAGDRSASIFVQQFNPELISIAGIYKIIEQTPEMLNKTVQVVLNSNGHLKTMQI